MRPRFPAQGRQSAERAWIVTIQRASPMRTRISIGSAPATVDVATIDRVAGTYFSHFGRGRPFVRVTRTLSRAAASAIAAGKAKEKP